MRQSGIPSQVCLRVAADPKVEYARLNDMFYCAASTVESMERSKKRIPVSFGFNPIEPHGHPQPITLKPINLWTPTVCIKISGDGCPGYPLGEQLHLQSFFNNIVEGIGKILLVEFKEEFM
jgi:hypothetical protein